MANRRGPLEGLTVLDFTRALAGPFATMTLADLGADVIKVEQPGTGDDTRSWGPPFINGESAYFMSVNRSKRSIELDLKTAADRDLARDIAAGADILVENFRPGVLARLGLGYDVLAGLNPALIYASISGYGQDSAEAHKAGYDPIIQARSGLMSVTGSADGSPARVGIAISDISASMWTVIGILAALRSRDVDGRGQWLDISLLDSQVSWLTNVAATWFATGATAGRYGTEHPSIVPSGVFEARDGAIMVAVGNDKMWQRMACAIGDPALVNDRRFDTNAGRVRHREELVTALAKVLSTDTSARWLARFEAHGVPAGPLNSIGDTLSDPLLADRGMIRETQHPTAGAVRSLGCPIRFERYDTRDSTPPPVLGEHSAEVAAEFASHPIRTSGTGTAAAS